MNQDNSNTIKMLKTNCEEIIEIGDVIMLDTSTLKVTKAVLNDCNELQFNSRMVVGVCSDSNNTAPLPGYLNGGPAKDVKQEVPPLELIHGGGAKEKARQLIRVSHDGEHIVNVCEPVELGDRLTISKAAGKAKSKDFLDNEYYGSRSIGKVIRYTADKTKVKVLLDVE